MVEAFLKADPDGETNGKGDDECAAALTALASRWKDAHRPLWQGWSESQGMTYGDNYGTFSLDARNYWQARTPVPEKKLTRIQIPHMQAIITDVASLQCQDELNLKCAPPTDTAAAAAACEAGDQLVSWIWSEHDFDSINLELREAAAVVGTVFVHCAWDSSIGSEVEVLDHYEPIPGPPDPMSGMPTSMGMKPVMRRMREGGFSHTLVSCFEALPDPAAKREWDGEGFIIEEKVAIATLRSAYPDFAEAFTRDSAPGAADGTYYVDRLKGIQPRGVGAYAGPASAQQAERSTVLTIYMRSCPEFYRGRMAVVAHGKLVFKGDNPVYPTEAEEAQGERFPTYHWPVFRFCHKVIAGSYWGQGVAPLLIDPQRKLNGVASKSLHMLKRTSHPVLVKPKRADFVKTDEPDQQITVPENMAPGSIYYLQAPGFPQELQYQERYSVTQMEELAGIHAGTRGATKDGQSGIQQRQLFQRDLGRLEMPKRRNDRQIGRVLSFDIRLWRRYATVPRTLQITGSNMETAVRQLSSADIAAGTSVVVYADLMMPKEPAGRMLHIATAIDKRIVDPSDPVTRAGLARLLGFPGWAKQFESMQFADQRLADDENLRMYAGEQPPVEFWHDHIQHLARHFAEMKSGTWIKATTALPTDAPEVAQRKAQTRAAFIAHVQWHQQALSALQQTQTQAQIREVMNFKDMPPEGKTQMAAQAGIQIGKQDGGGGGPGPGAAPTSASPNGEQAQGGPPAQKQAA